MIFSLLTAAIDERDAEWYETERYNQKLYTENYFKENMVLGIITIIIIVVLFVWGLAGKRILTYTHRSYSDGDADQVPGKIL